MGNTEGLETTLVSVLERRPEGCEVFVVLNVPYHDPYGLQGEIQILQAPLKQGWLTALIAVLPLPRHRLYICLRWAMR